MQRFKAHAAVAAIAVLAAATLPAFAAGDPVPLPHLRPAYAGTGNAAGAASTAARPNVQVPINPNSPFSPSQQIALANISAYFNSFALLEGDFIQIGPNGEQSEGVFFMRKPGKIRFHYNPPAKLDVISDGSTVAIKDGRSGTQDMYPLSKTPLRYLLSPNIDLTSSSLVSQVQEEADLIMVTIVQRGAFAEGTLTLTFDKKTYELRQWQVTDAQGLNTSVAIFNTTAGKQQTDPNLYRVVPQ
ncbi:MAG: outer membrane lipoprotein carrier protein LolA [Bauldia sp.]